jgi:hypothetical protein
LKRDVRLRRPGVFGGESLKEENMAENGRKTRILVCVECGEEFVFTAAAQEYFEEKGYNQSPKRCKVCHSKYKRERKVAS